jgi:putative ABC transport system substrate-binding protein
MNKTFWNRFLDSCSDNRKSKIENLKWLGVLVLLVGCVGMAEAQQLKKVPRIGFLCAMSGPSPHTEGFLQGLRERGYTEGQNIKIEYRFTKGKTDPFRELAMELVRLKLDVIVVASAPAIRPTMEATNRIPIVMAQSDDPVRSGFVASLARPGRNVTGLSSMAPELGAKQLELLKEIVPKLSRAAILRNAANSGDPLQSRETEATARAVGVKLQFLEFRGAEDLEHALAAIKKERGGALIVPQDLMFFDYQRRLVDFGASNRLPSVYAWRDFAEAGGLMSYGPSDRDLFRRAATYVDRILKGTKPADLPVEQPTKFEFVINLKAAKQIGLTIPQSVLFRADKVIK